MMNEFEEKVLALVPYILAKSALANPEKTAYYIATNYPDGRKAAQLLTKTVYNLLIAYVEMKCQEAVDDGIFVTEISSEELVDVGIEFLTQLVQGKVGDKVSAE